MEGEESKKTEIICIVDRSGSMRTIQENAIGGLNNFVESQKKEPGRTKFSLILFNHLYQTAVTARPIQQVDPLTDSIFSPWGTTALLDAIGQIIHDTENRFKLMREEEHPDLVIIAILTDGRENASREYNNKLVAEMIRKKREKDDWRFIFLAANQDAFRTARILSIAQSKTHYFKATPAGTDEILNDFVEMVSNERKSRSEHLRRFLERDDG